MLAKLFGSEARAKILFTFFLNPEKPYYIREMSRDLGLQVNSVRRELDNLHGLGVLEVVSDSEEEEHEQKKGDKKYFRANPDFLLFQEMKSLFQKSQLLESREFVTKIEEHCDPCAIYLNGVFTGAIGSPTDLLIIGNIKKITFLPILKEFEVMSGREINYTIMEEGEFKYRREISDRFINQVLHNRCIKVYERSEETGRKKRKK
jgi:hypothetical protein